MPPPVRRRGGPSHDALLLLGLATPCCGGDEVSRTFVPPAPALLRFREGAGAFASFRRRTGAAGDYRLPETMGGGCAVFDADGDGDLDVFLVDSGDWTGSNEDAAPFHALFRNEGGVFVDATAASGLRGRAYGMGCAIGDFDGDGDADLYLLNHGRNALLRNGGGAFSEVTEAARVGDPRWSVSAAFLDADLDGDLDLYVVNYLDEESGRDRSCFTGTVRDYCSPRVYEGAPDRFYRNLGDGTFADATEEAGLLTAPPLPSAAKGLGVVAADLDGDADPDLYVANDSTPNFLWLNRGDGVFLEVGLEWGVAVSGEGLSQAGMGVDAGDFDGDGDFDLFVTNLDLETNALYRNEGGWFTDATASARLAAPSLGLVGFGADFFDADLDGRLDLLVANGHILVNVERTTGTIRYAQPAQVFRNVGEGRFEETDAGEDLRRPRVARGAATGDLDGDGDLDLVLVECEGGAALLWNETRGGGRALALRLRGTRSNREGIGARVRVREVDLDLLEEVRGGSSYASACDRTLHFGLGPRTRADRVEVRWPSGRSEAYGPLETGRAHLLVEGAGTVLP